MLKNVSNQRVQNIQGFAVRGREGLETTKLTEVATRLGGLSRNLFPRIAIKTKGRIVFVSSADVLAIEAKGKHVLVQGQSSSHFVRESISAMAATLSTCGFTRIHRSVLVNSLFIDEIQPRSTGEYLVRMKGGKEYVATRTFRRNFKLLAEFWIGVNPFLPNSDFEA